MHFLCCISSRRVPWKSPSSMDVGCLVRGVAFVVLEQSRYPSLKGISAYSPQFPGVFGEGPTERLALLSLRNGIYTNLEWQLSKNPDLKPIQIQPLSQRKKQAVLEKWTEDSEGESLITHTELEFKGGC